MKKQTLAATPFQQALALHQQGKLAEAEAIYRQVLKQDAKHADALHLLGVVHLQRGQFKEGEVLIADALKLQPKTPVFHGNYGGALRGLGRLDEAVKSYEQAVSLDPAYLDGHLNLGSLLNLLGRFEAAVESNQKALKLMPTHALAHCQLGNALAGLGRHEAAVESFDRAIAAKPDYLEAHSNRGHALHALGQLEAALASYGQVVAFDTGNVQGLFSYASTLLELNRFEAAVRGFDRVISLNPKYAHAYGNRGVALHQLKLFEQALESYDQAITLKPDYAEAFSNRGDAFCELIQFEAAVASCDRAIALKPDYAEAYSNRGNALNGLKQFESALASCDQAIALKLDYAEAYGNRGNALLGLEQFESALASYDQAIALKPDYAEAYSNRGNALQGLKQFESALASYDQAIALRPDYAEAYSNRGIALKGMKQFESALASYDQAIALKPDYVEAYGNRGNALKELKRFESALASYDQAIALRPDYAEAYSNRGNALKELNRFESALASFDQAIALKPDYASAYWNKSLACLLTGDFALGWALYEWRWQWEEFVANNARPDLLLPRWSGVEPLVGKTILLHSEQGLGDTLQFVRYVDQVLALGAAVLLEVPKVLLELFKPFSGRVRLLAKGEALPAHDFHCPLLSLPLAFKTRLDTIPKANAYLASDPEKRDSWAARLGEKTGPRIGLVWSGNPQHKNDHNRSLLLSEFLSGLPSGCEYISLQKEVREADKAALATAGIRHFGDELKDFADTAALCDLMDVVISVDTSVAHLAAALGKTTWILLPHVPDWRWLLDRDDSPWYPTARLYRQPASGDWASVLARVHDDLLRLLARARPPANEKERVLRIITVDLKNEAISSAWLALLDHYARDPMGGGTGLSEYAKANLVRELAELPSFHGALAFVGDEAVGLINCFSGFSTFAARPLLNIHDVVTHADWRGQGIAQALLDWAAQRGRELGCCKLTLEVLSNNTRALAAYERAGFAPYVLDPQAGQALFLQKYLDEENS